MDRLPERRATLRHTVAIKLGPSSASRAGDPARTDGAAPLLRMTGISKSFAGTKALDDVCLEVFSGQIVAVVGQNGSGKSTLVKVLAGIHQPDPGGSIEIRDAAGNPLESHGGHQQSLHFIHQDLGLLPMLSTTENLDLSRPMGSRWIRPGNRAAEHRRAARLVERFGVAIDVRAPVATLSPAERAIVAIARALDGWTRPDNVLVLDEPTTALHSDEVDRLFRAIRRVASQGAGVIFISHRLDEVRAIADRVVALRDGKKVAEVAIGHLQDAALIRAIVGSSVAATHRTTPTRGGAVTLAVAALCGRVIQDIDLSVRAGEIIGVTGVLGSGREELAGLLFGAERRTSGAVRVNDHALDAGDMAGAIDRGVAFVPPDRHRRGAVMQMNVRENLTLPGLAGLTRRFSRVDRKAERRDSARWSQAIGLRPLAPERAMTTFSGGNQQKVVLAKWLRTRPRLLLLDEPTQGVDVGAKATIYDLIMKAASDGTAVVVCSSDTKELVAICDRVLVLQAGRVVSEVSASALTEETLLRRTLEASVVAAEPARDLNLPERGHTP
jgi:ABC-type sugar transport system ATPase subunit